ncbi:unnamed protein product [Mytilus coruscus]|uniref:Integrase catalytic domain-containing protein n=1 Tax=Mytilus coruscus TaxID=42192 RepID=A0A6J8B9R6_MYTCO|nr:unnamed protein product [Mytilus coruscus]
MFGLARTTEAITIPKKSESIITISISKFKNGDQVLLEPRPTLTLKHLIGAKCVVTVHKGKAVLKLLNPTNSDILLKRREILAQVYNVNDADILPFEPQELNDIERQNATKQKNHQRKTKEKFSQDFDLEHSDLNESQKQKLLKLLKTYKHIFANDLSQLGVTNAYFHTIETIPGASPISLPFYRTSHKQQIEINKQVDEMEKNGIIAPSNSVWHSPVILVAKKNSSELRFAIDYRKLIFLTIPMNFPLPRLESVFDTISEMKSKVFSCVGLKSSFWQIPLDQETKYKAAFITQNGIYEFKRLPYGLANSLVSFQTLMTSILREMNWKSVLVKRVSSNYCGVQAYHPYLSSAQFTVQTDHKALCRLNNVKNPSARIGRWALALQPYKFDVIYKEGKTNSVADALSRREYNNANEKDSSLTESGQMEEDIFFISEDQQLSNEKGKKSPRSHEVDIETSDHHNTKISSVSEIENCSKQLLIYSDERIYVEFIYPDDPVAFVAPVTEDDIDEAVNDKEHLFQMQKDCPDFKPILEYLLTDDLPDEDKMARKAVFESERYQILSGILFHFDQRRSKKLDENQKYTKQLCIPKVLCNDVLRSYHDSLAGGGHLGIDKVHESIRLKYWWPTIYADVETRWTEAFPLKTQGAKEIARVIYDQIICRYGAPRILFSDRGRSFMSHIVKRLCEIFQITQHHTSSYHPQTNGLVERQNSTIAQTIRTYCGKDQNLWPIHLQSVTMAIRKSPASNTTEFSPYYMVFGQEMKLPFDIALIPKDNLSQATKDHIKDIQLNLEIVHEMAKENDKRHKAYDKERHDQKAKIPDFEAGDLVLKAINKVPVGESRKLYDKFEGPYRIQYVGENYTYKLLDTRNNKPHKSMINACHLKHYNNPAVLRVQEEIDESDEDSSQEEEINDDIENSQANNDPNMNVDAHTQPEQPPLQDKSQTPQANVPEPDPQSQQTRDNENKKNFFKDAIKGKFGNIHHTVTLAIMILITCPMIKSVTAKTNEEKMNVIQRINYGVVFKQESFLYMSSEDWLHTFEVELPQNVNLPRMSFCIDKRSLVMANVLQQHGSHFSSFITLIDNRTNNLMNGVKTNAAEIKQITYKFYNSLTSFQHSMTNISKILITLVNNANILRENLNQLQSSIQSLAEGRISPFLLPKHILAHSLHKIQRIMSESYPGFQDFT